MVLDLNDFKATNDRYGHPVGDTVLKDVGEFLVTHLRQHDVACRTGGDEFSVLLPICRGRTAATWSTACAAGSTPRTPRAGSRSRSASAPRVGRRRATPSTRCMTRADEAMYADKHRHRTRRSPPSARREVPRRSAARRARTHATA